MAKDQKSTSVPGKEKEQDNIGYENTEKRTDRDDREMNRLQTTDTDNDEGKTRGPEDDDKEKNK